jgi:hypothetical protein
MQVNTMRMLYTHQTKGDNSIIFWQDNETIIAEGSKFISDVYLLLATFVESLLRQSEFDWEKIIT